MDKIAKSEIMFGNFMILRRKKIGICFRKRNTEKNMSHGIAVEQPCRDLQMPWNGKI